MFYNQCLSFFLPLFSFLTRIYLYPFIIVFILEQCWIYKRAAQLVQRFLIYFISGFPTVNILYWNGTFVTSNEYFTICLKSILYSDLFHFYPMSFFCTRIPSNTPNYMQSCLFKLLLTVTVRVILFLMTLTIWRNIAEAFRSSTLVGISVMFFSGSN